MNISSASYYEPQTGRLGLLHRSIGLCLAFVLTICLSIYTAGPDPKISILVAAVCVFLGGKRLLTPAVWPLFAIVGYTLFLSVVFPSPRPELGMMFQYPMFLVDCMLLTALVLGGQSVRRQYALLLGVLAISLIGTLGDATGHDMIAMVPVQTTDYDGFYRVTQLGGDIQRVRGFFAESGVLGAVSLGYGTVLGLGALALIRLRVSLRYAWLGLLGVICMGGAIFCLTVTKSGLVMVAAGFLGFLAVLFCSRNARCRGMAALGFFAIAIAGCAFLFSPFSLSGYLRGEILAFINPSPAVAASHMGMMTRLGCWRLALKSIHLYPLGVGQYGLDSVLSQVGEAGFTHELREMFSEDYFGLKNALANLISQGGLPGLGLLFYWLCVAFIQPICDYLKEGSETGVIIAGLYGASALACFAFLFSCELYPSFAFLLVLKFHADAVAQACIQQPARGVESVELIG